MDTEPATHAAPEQDDGLPVRRGWWRAAAVVTGLTVLLVDGPAAAVGAATAFVASEVIFDAAEKGSRR